VPEQNLGSQLGGQSQPQIGCFWRLRLLQFKNTLHIYIFFYWRTGTTGTWSIMNACCVWDLTVWLRKPDGSPETTLSADVLTAITQWQNWCTEECKSWCFQLEAAPSTGQYHLQGRVSLKVKKRLREIATPAVAHMSQTSKANWTNQFYVMKSESRIRGPWKDTDPYVPIDLREVMLRPWQQQVVDSLTLFVPRTVNVILEKVGNQGKSFLCRYCAAHGLANCIPPLNSFKEMMQMAHGMPKRPAFLVDMPRALPKVRLNEFYAAIERIKDGLLYDPRYSFKERIIDPPVVWVFTNTEPDLSLLSRDRWQIWVLANLELFPEE